MLCFIGGQREENPVPCVHDFVEKEIQTFRTSLLKWYRENKRDLPWRKQLENPDVNQRAYAVWVSEIMLQQTQVATVISYYNKWMEKWPTVEDLAKANLEEVNEMWSGLGYYSRGRRLFEGAVKVVNSFQGRMPTTAESLLKELPGVGRYTAGAIASIANNQPTGLVDGNVIRVLSRMRVIGADSTSAAVQDKIWSDANKLVDPVSPGDFNQGLMELGATICTPKSPDCSKCPVSSICMAYIQTEIQKTKSSSKLVVNKPKEIPDIECLVDGCNLCIPEQENYDESLGVQNYPRKGKKKAAREEVTDVCIVCQRCSSGGNKYLIVQRPSKGLLAGLWEFPSLVRDPNFGDIKTPICLLRDACGVTCKLLSTVLEGTVGEVTHIFSHIHQTYFVQKMTIDEGVVELPSNPKTALKWVTKEEFLDAGTSTAMKKVFKAYENSCSPKQDKKKKEDPKQPSISAFFKKKS
ncbi:hypothetical protein FSP39_003963 [Pinctada imbricata]|uniref:Adenine DNA glycosylase n=1 Tax=Pinctada imbricata TaxID=66713 RepID=A0AA88XS59_PINIB|nr:hypothetical protein FSP39_003963 [Pinctada imbricata]